jgi:hypothetical protein
MQAKVHVGKSSKGREDAKMDEDEYPPEISLGLEALQDQPQCGQGS